VSGDHDSFQQRSPAAYRTLFREAGFTQAGPHMYVVPDMARSLVELEKPQRP
jgi:hypothetical protein